MHIDRTYAQPAFLPLGVVAGSFARALTALLIFSGAFVLIEPGPYEVLLPAALIFWMLSGLKTDWRLSIYLLFSVLIYLGGMMGVTLTLDWTDGFIYMTITLFLAVSGYFFASIILTDPEWATKTINRYYILGACLTGLGGIAGYFGLGPSELLTLFGRAKGFFKDPNVFGAFLVYPVIYIFTSIIRGEEKNGILRWLALGIIGLALLMSFSRGAIGHAIFSGMVAAWFAFVTSPSLQKRLRIAILCGAIIFVSIVGAIAALSIPQVASLAEERFSTNQSYDSGYEGRFSRHARGFALALEKPFGIGLNNFGRIFTEDPHNVFLKMLMDYGWLGFFAFTTIVLTTFYMGLKAILHASPFRDTAIAAYASFIGLIGLSMIIDINHWRHFWLLTGLIWGLYLATLKSRKKPI